MRKGSFSHSFLTLAVKRFEGDGAALGIARLLYYFSEIYPRHRLESLAGTRRSLPMKLSQSWPAYAATRDVTVRRLITVTIPLRARNGSLPYVMVCSTSIS